MAINTQPDITEPTEPGFYKYDGGRQAMLFLLVVYGGTHQWYVISDSATLNPCAWSYISQALGVWNLEKIR